MAEAAAHKMDVLMIGAGEYNVGFVQTVHGAASDKPAGVVALTLFDLRRRGLVGRTVLADINGTRLPAVRKNIQEKIGNVYQGLDTTLECFPEDHVERDDQAPLRAIETMQPGSVAIIFTPDDTHFKLAMACIKAGLHVLVAKPLVKTLAEHKLIAQAAQERGILCGVEFHKRFDPMYSDACARARSSLGPFSFFSSYMAQQKTQIETFRAWAGISSDISYYLNSHHVDIHTWLVGDGAVPVRVVASASSGVAEEKLGRPCEDTITLLVQWRNLADGSLGTASYTAGWISPKADCHTQQYMHYLGRSGELRVDQAHRGYTGATDATGFATYNPLYMRYTPDAAGRFQGQSGYGYVSIERFIRAAASVKSGELSVADVEAEGVLALASNTQRVTAILEAGRQSLNAGGAPVEIISEGLHPLSLRVLQLKD